MLSKSAKVSRSAGSCVGPRSGERPETPVDLLFSNAALHWIEDHASVFARLLGDVAPGGAFAVQMPRNWEAPSHTSISDAIRDGPWRDRLEPLIRPQPTLAPERYWDLLAPLVRTLDIWETEYLQVLDGDNPVADNSHRTGSLQTSRRANNALGTH